MNPQIKLSLVWKAMVIADDLINASDKNQKYEFDVERRIKEDFTVPLMALNNENLHLRN